MSTNESFVRFHDQVKRSLLTGGLGSKEAFNLNWDRLIITRTIKGLPDSAQLELLKQFNTFDVNLDNLNHFLNTLSTASSSSKSNNNKISKLKKVTKKQMKQAKYNVNPVVNSTYASKAANTNASVRDWKCSRGQTDRAWHLRL